jgi:hypothetical protein
LCWVPGHASLPGHEAAFAAAKEAALLENLNPDRALGNDVHALLPRAIISWWNVEWTQTVGNKSEMVPHVWHPSCTSIRTEEAVVAHLRISCTRLTHGYLSRGGPALVAARVEFPLPILTAILGAGISQAV